jgi:hypothetical protein
LIDRQRYAQYHYHEINDLFAAFQAKHLARTPSILALTDEGNWDFDQFVMKSGAHGVACLQCLHSLSDILAHAIYYSLGLNLTPAPLCDRDISIAAILGRLQQISSCTPIAAKIAAFTASKSYKHVAAAANVSKHRSVVKSSVHEDWERPNSERHSVRFMSFRHAGVIYPAMTIRDVLQPVYGGASVLVVDIGNEINSVLAASAPSQETPLK